jgi:hypothetical protein
MSTSRDADDDHRSDPPLWSMGLAVIIILAIPLVLYLLAPAGPLRTGDTIFSQGQQRVLIAIPVTTLGPQMRKTCLLDPNHPLIILELPHDHIDGDILATVQGNPVAEWPFCPLNAQVLMNTHQMLQKPDLWGASRRALAGLFRG